jgi:exodeoxyribonuclease VII large subunit
VLQHAALSEPSQQEIYSVSRLNREVRLRLSSSFPLLWVEGEISNLARPSSGHLYFTLKDAEAQVRCAMFKNHHLLLEMTPEHGMQVWVQARVGLYEKRGEYQLIVEHMEEAGSGALQRAFEALKQKLAAEGLFDSSRKKPLPAFPKRLGVITSPSGAAIRDILSVLERRYPVLPILIYPVPVQGEGAAEAIACAVREADRTKDCDVLIVSRGGGSIEDLWAFNEEVVARAIADCELPLVSGVGHEIDFTIADFVADQRAPTPSAAAALISPNRDELLATLAQLSRNLHRFIRRRLEALQQNVQWLRGRLHQQHPQQRLQQSSQRLDELERRLHSTVNLKINRLSIHINELRRLLEQQSPAVRIAQIETQHSQLDARLKSTIHRRLEDRSRRLQLLARALSTVSPLSTLARGYAIVTRQRDQTLIRTRRQIRIGGKVHIRLAKDRLSAEITGSEPLLDPDRGETLT